MELTIQHEHLESSWEDDQSHHFVVMDVSEIQALMGMADITAVQLDTKYGRIVAASREEAEDLLHQGVNRGHYPFTSQLVEEVFHPHKDPITLTEMMDDADIQPEGD